jgi:hypothetical protein
MLLFFLHMAVNTSLTCLDTRPGVMTFPATLVDNHFGTECFIRDVGRVCVMTLATPVVNLVRCCFWIVAGLTTYPGRRQVVRMGRIQFDGMNLVVTLHAFHFDARYMEIVWKNHSPY